MMTGWDHEKGGIRVCNDWDGGALFTNSELSRIYAAVKDYVDVFFSYDLIDDGEERIPAIYLIPRGSAEMAWVDVLEPHVQRFAMNLRENELFDPKDEGIIYIREDTHVELVRTLRAVAHILDERLGRLGLKENRLDRV